MEETSGRGRSCSMSLRWREREECKVNPLVAGSWYVAGRRKISFRGFFFGGIFTVRAPIFAGFFHVQLRVR
jgi:hypothetical protein